MNAHDWITDKQVAWAENRNLPLVGSAGERGRQVYTSTIDANLFRLLKEGTRADITRGDGGELNAEGSMPAKIQALHSSSALGVNVFDYWRDSPDLSVLTAACGLSRAGSKVSGDVHFEQRFPIDDRFRYPPNLDVVLTLKGHRYQAFAIECKFTEAYSTRRHEGMKPEYLEIDGVWTHLPATRGLAEEISPADTRFEHLHAAQLIKHLLGLNRRFGHGRYRFLYLWYDTLGEAGAKHRREVEDFAKVARADGVTFHELTYQELIIGLARHRKDHPEYVAYLTGRYL